MTKFLEEILAELDRLHEADAIPYPAMVMDGITTRHYVVRAPGGNALHRVIRVIGTSDLKFFKELPSGVDDEIDLDDKVKEFCFHMSEALKEAKNV